MDGTNGGEAFPSTGLNGKRCLVVKLGSGLLAESNGRLSASLAAYDRLSQWTLDCLLRKMMYGGRADRVFSSGARRAGGRR